MTITVPEAKSKGRNSALIQMVVLGICLFVNVILSTLVKYDRRYWTVGRILWDTITAPFLFPLVIGFLLPQSLLLVVPWCAGWFWVLSSKLSGEQRNIMLAIVTGACWGIGLPLLTLMSYKAGTSFDVWRLHF